MTALCTKLRMDSVSAAPADCVGGSTYGFKVWEGHPYFDDVTGLLARLRVDVNRLREQVTAFNADHPEPAQTIRVVTYLGQTVLDSDSNDGKERT